MNNSEDQIAKLATNYSPHDIDFFRKVVGHYRISQWTIYTHCMLPRNIVSFFLRWSQGNIAWDSKENKIHYFTRENTLTAFTKILVFLEDLSCEISLQHVDEKWPKHFGRLASVFWILLFFLLIFNSWISSFSKLQKWFLFCFRLYRCFISY